MEWITTDTVHPLSERDRRSRRGQGYLHLGDLPKSAGERPDPAYWTAYDFHMVEREARAARRAQVYSMIAAFSKRLRQRIFGFRITALTRHPAT